MDQKLRLVQTDTKAPEPEPRVLNPSERAAAEVAALLDEIVARIPRLTAPAPGRKNSVRGARTVRREYVVAMIDVVERHRELTEVRVQLDAAQARETLEFRDAFRPIAMRLAVVLKSLTFTMDARWAAVVQQALAAYAMAQAISGAPGRESLAAELELVAKDLNRKDKPKKKKEAGG
ncbi:MAG TPA: hypothetical protein VGF28_09410 [Thermoanaerobaculia bacterium]|jgi:hypothetical protein